MASASNRKEKNIQVYVRCRPLNSSEKKVSSPSVVEVNPQNREVVVKERLGEKELSKKFTFDRVFGPESSQIDVYNTVVSSLIEEVLMGYNCTVFAYGQTGTGKTHTMIGSKSSHNLTWEDDPLAGIIPRTLNNLYDALNQLEVEFNVRVSFLELYNEELYDLLAPIPECSKLRMLKDNGKMGAGTIWVQGLEEKIVHDKGEVYGILEKGTERRKVGSTLMNDQSSRSHTVFTITIHIKESNIDGEDLLKIGKLNLVDLAGSECIGRSGAIDRRAREAGSINQSLLTLGRVITALVERAPHVPYRESKLTRLLQDSLGGRTKTSIIATISPALVNIEETLSTLDYAHRARNIMNKPEVNQKLTKKAVMKEYIEEIERLRKDLVASRDKNGMFIDVENYEFMQNKISGLSNEVKEKFAEIEALKEQLLLVEDRFTLTKSELCQKERQLDYTTIQLSRTETQLKDTVSTLKVAVRERDEQKYLVNHRVKTEALLTEQAKELISVVEETSNHVESLHSKIERKKLVENINLEKRVTLHSTFHKNLITLETIIRDSFDKHNNNVQEMKEKLDANVSKQAQLNVDNMIVLQELRDCVTKSYLKASQSLEEAEFFVQKWTENTTQLNDKSMAIIINDQETFYNQKAQILLNTLSQFILNQNKLISEQNELFKQKIQFSNSVLEKSLDAVKLQLRQLQLYGDQIFQEQTQGLTNICENRKMMDKDNENLLFKWKSQKEIFTELFFKTLNDTDKIINDHSNAICAKLSEDVQSANKCQELGLHHSKKLTEELNQISTNVDSMVTRSLQDLQDAHVNHLYLTKKIESDLSELNSTRNAAEENYVTNLENLKEGLENNKQFLIQETAVLNNKILANKTVALLSLTDSMAQFEVKNKLLLELSTIREDSLKSASQQIQLCNTMGEWSDEFKQLLCSEVKNFDTAIEKYVNEEFAKDVPTGQTPIRKEYQYPQELVQASPHEQILHRLRQQVSLESGVKFHLPDENEFGEIAVSPMKHSEESPNADHLVKTLSPSSMNYGSIQDLSASVESNISEVSINTKENKECYVKPTTGSKLKVPSINKFSQKKILSSRNTTPITSSPKLKRK